MIRKEKVANKRFEAYGLLGSKFKSLALLLVLFINFWSQWSESKRKFPLECSLKFDEVVAGKLEILLYPKQQFISIERVRGGVKKSGTFLAESCGRASDPLPPPGGPHHPKVPLFFDAAP